MVQKDKWFHDHACTPQPPPQPPTPHTTCQGKKIHERKCGRLWPKLVQIKGTSTRSAKCLFMFVWVGFWQNRFFADFCFWAAGFFRGICHRFFSPHFCGNKRSEKSSRKIPDKTPQNLHHKNPRHISAGPTFVALHMGVGAPKKIPQIRSLDSKIPVVGVLVCSVESTNHLETYWPGLLSGLNKPLGDLLAHYLPICDPILCDTSKIAILARHPNKRRYSVPCRALRCDWAFSLPCQSGL